MFVNLKMTCPDAMSIIACWMSKLLCFGLEGKALSSVCWLPLLGLFGNLLWVLLQVLKDICVEPLKLPASSLLLDWSLELGFWFTLLIYPSFSSVLWSHWSLHQLLHSSAWTVWQAWSCIWLVQALVDIISTATCLHLQYYCIVESLY